MDTFNRASSKNQKENAQASQGSQQDKEGGGELSSNIDRGENEFEEMYRGQMRNTKQEAVLVLQYAQGSALNKDHFLSDIELYYLQNLSNNEALLEYYHQVQEGLCSIFIQSKIVDGKFKIDGSTDSTNALTIAGEILPEVGSVLT